MLDWFTSQITALNARCCRRPGMPVTVLAILTSLGVFGEISEDVSERDDKGFDRTILLAMRNVHDISKPWGSEATLEVGRDLSALGGITVLTALTLASIGAALFLRKPRLAALIGISISGGMMLTVMMKRGFDRPRPDLVPHSVFVTSAGFPSGHAMMSAIVYLTIGVLLARTQPQRAFRFYLIFLSFCLTFLIGLSRIYLGVHWPTDVFAGWAFGVAWALIFGLIAVKIDPPHGSFPDPC